MTYTLTIEQHPGGHIFGCPIGRCKSILDSNSLHERSEQSAEEFSIVLVKRAKPPKKIHIVCRVSYPVDSPAQLGPDPVFAPLFPISAGRRGGRSWRIRTLPN